ncbi:MAG: type II toxin-antitoxin system RelE/ParE family toxin [Crocosphaera sp.]
MNWSVLFHDEFAIEFLDFPKSVQKRMLAKLKVLEQFGSELGRPHVDTLNGSRYRNMKELRFQVDNGVWRVAFIFDPQRNAILLVGGDKSGIKEKRFYKTLIDKADSRYQQHLDNMS